MQRSTLSRRKRPQSLLRRGIVWALAVTLFANVITIMPVMLRMALAQPSMTPMAGAPCSMHMGGQNGMNPAHGTPPCDHRHCLICQGGVGPAVLGAAIARLAAPLSIVVAAFEHRTIFVAQPFRTSYISQAPPAAA
jgi:hypothetical protein